MFPVTRPTLIFLFRSWSFFLASKHQMQENKKTLNYLPLLNDSKRIKCLTIIICYLFVVSSHFDVKKQNNIVLNKATIMFFFIRPSSDMRIMVWWCPSGSLSGSPSVRSPSVRSPSARFPHFIPTCLDILSWNFAHDFFLMYFRSSLSVITLRQFLKELCLFVNLEYRKYTVFRTFLLHALTYWAEILHMTLF